MVCESLQETSQLLFDDKAINWKDLQSFYQSVMNDLIK